MADRSLVDAACDFRSSFRILFMVSLLAVVILTPSAFAVDPDSGTFVITVVQLVTFAVLLVASGGMMVVCGGRGEPR